ncbi:MAG: hypothetical protein IKC46_09860 [Lachnospiraceae bacterium]|nr:hypothetical protein [Lachnospiraceae bacterium]
MKHIKTLTTGSVKDLWEISSHESPSSKPSADVISCAENNSCEKVS